MKTLQGLVVLVAALGFIYLTIYLFVELLFEGLAL